MTDSPRIETGTTPEQHEAPLRWPPDYNDMRVFTSHALRSWVLRKGFTKKPWDQLNALVHDESFEPRERDDAAAAVNILARNGWLAWLKDEKPEFPKGRKFPLDTLKDQEVLFFWINLKGHIAHNRFAQLAQQRIAQRASLTRTRTARQRAAQISIEEMDPRVPDSFPDRISFRVTGTR